MRRFGGGVRIGQGGRGCKQFRLTAGQEEAQSHTHTIHMYSQNKGLWDRNNSLVLLRRSLSLDSSRPLLLSPSLPPSHSHSLSQEDLKYQYPFLLDIAFSLQSAFCCPFIVKTSGEIPCRNILSNAALPASNTRALRGTVPLARSFGKSARGHTHTHTYCSWPQSGVIVPVFRERQAAQTMNYIHFYPTRREFNIWGIGLSFVFFLSLSLSLSVKHTQTHSAQAPYSQLTFSLE